MKHAYTKEQMQTAIDAAYPVGHKDYDYLLDSDSSGLEWESEAPYRLAIMQAALAALPEPEPPTVDGKTPGQVAWDAGNEVQRRKFPNEPVMSWEEGEELHEQLEAAASAVLAAFGNQSQPAEKADADLKNAHQTAENYHKQALASEDRATANLRKLEKVEAELARVREMYDAKVIEESESVKPQLSQLRPIAEAGPVPEGCVRVYGYYHALEERWLLTMWRDSRHSHFADIQIPAAKDDNSAKPDPYAELKAAQADGKTIEVFVKDDEYGPDRWSKKENNSWTLPPENYRIKPEPETFEAHGKVWTRHTPEDPMPCDGKAKIQILHRVDGYANKTTYEAKSLFWGKGVESSHGGYSGDIIGWRYADEPTPEPLEPAPWTPKVGDVVTLKSGGPKMTVMDIEENGEIWCSWFNDHDGVLDQDFPTACLQPA